MCLQGGLPSVSLATYMARVVARKRLSSATLYSGMKAGVARQRGSGIPYGGRLQVRWRGVYRAQVGTVLRIRQSCLKDSNWTRKCSSVTETLRAHGEVIG